VLKRIKQRGVLRAGYNINSIPFAFINKQGSLIGYGVEMAYDLARFLNVSRLEFIPIGNTLLEPLNSGACDIIITSVMITPKWLEHVEFTNSYMTIQPVFVVRDYRKDEFLKLEDVRRMKNLRVAVLSGSGLLAIASDMLPNASIIEVNSYKDFFEGDVADAYFTTKEHGSFVALLYPFFDVAAFDPKGVYKILLGYPVAMGNETFLGSLNHWLELEEKSGELGEKYDYWILGKNAEKKEPRWSVISNVLRWVPAPNMAQSS